MSDIPPAHVTAKPKQWSTAVLLGVFVVTAALGAGVWLVWGQSMPGQSAMGGTGNGTTSRPASGQVSEPPRTPSTPVVTVTDLLKQAAALRAEKRLREAEIILTRAVQTDRDNVSAWRSLAAVQRDMAMTSVAAGRLLSAAQEADRAKTSVNGITAISVDPSTPSLDPKVVLDEEDATAKTTGAVRTAIDAYSAELIGEATTLADDAYHSPWNAAALGMRTVRNDRDKVVEGLKKLRGVFELGAWASEKTRTNANDCYSKLKKLVNPEEWNDLLARAGFDPASRDTLKKWGLE